MKECLEMRFKSGCRLTQFLRALLCVAAAVRLPRLRPPDVSLHLGSAAVEPKGWADLRPSLHYIIFLYFLLLLLIYSV